MLAGSDPASILRAVRTVVSSSVNWRIPAEYQVPDVSTSVVKIVLGHVELRTPSTAAVQHPAV